MHHVDEIAIRRRNDTVPRNCQFLSPSDIPDVRILDLRHSLATLLVSGDEPMGEIGRLLGHTQARTIERRVHLIQSQLVLVLVLVGGSSTMFQSYTGNIFHPILSHQVSECPPFC